MPGKTVLDPQSTGYHWRMECIRAQNFRIGDSIMQLSTLKSLDLDCTPREHPPDHPVPTRRGKPDTANAGG